MRKSLFGILAGTICMAIISLAVPANALITDMGGGALYDDLSGLFVLSDANQFCNMTYSQQVAQIDLLNSMSSSASTQMHGAWRMATLDDFRSFSPNFWLNPDGITQITPSRTFYYPVIDQIRYDYWLRLGWPGRTDEHYIVIETLLNTANSGWYEDIGQTMNIGDSSFESYLGALVVADPIPEPGTMLLLGTGLIGLVGIIKRRKS